MSVSSQAQRRCKRYLSFLIKSKKRALTVPALSTSKNFGKQTKSATVLQNSNPSSTASFKQELTIEHRIPELKLQAQKHAVFYAPKYNNNLANQLIFK